MELKCMQCTVKDSYTVPAETMIGAVLHVLTLLHGCIFGKVPYILSIFIAFTVSSVMKEVGL